LEFLIRSAEESDFESILKLMQDFAQQDGIDPTSVNFNKPSFLRFGFGPEQCFCCDLGLVDGKIISYTMYSIRYSGVTGTPILYMEDIYISSQYRNLGLGKSLMDHTIKAAESRSCGRMEWVVDADNMSAKEFYKQLGAQPMKELRIFRLQVNPNENS